MEVQDQDPFGPKAQLKPLKSFNTTGGLPNGQTGAAQGAGKVGAVEK